MEPKHYGARITVTWNDRHKRWELVGRTGQHVIYRTADTTGGVDQTDLHRILDAVKREMESWLF